MKKNNTDSLSTMSDIEVGDLLKYIKREISRLERRIRNDTGKGIRSSLFDAEIEYCYVKRESDVRAARREKHAEYLKNFKIMPSRFQKGV